MVRILTACLLSFYAINASAADSSCSSQAAEKKLAGAAKTSFMGKCERDAKASCDAAAGCPASTPVRQRRPVEEERVNGSSSPVKERRWDNNPSG